MSAQPFREAAVIELELVKIEEHRGGREHCPACHSPLITQDEKPQFCTGTSWWRRFFFGHCARMEPHLHQHCIDCNATWMCAIVEPEGFR